MKKYRCHVCGKKANNIKAHCISTSILKQQHLDYLKTRSQFTGSKGLRLASVDNKKTV